jgi:hypothetical protein
MVGVQTDHRVNVQDITADFLREPAHEKFGTENFRTREDAC